MRVATFNVLHGCRPDGAVDHQALARACAGLDADVLGLQELDLRVPRSGFVNQAARVARACGPDTDRWFSRACRVKAVGVQGNALVVRGSMSAVERVALPRPSRDGPRSGLVADVRLSRPGTPTAALAVAVAHLSVVDVEARWQLHVVVDRLALRPPPRLLLADANLAPDVVEPIVSDAGLVLAGGPPTFPADHPRARIDHVAATGLEIGPVEVVRTPVSDHRALVVELEGRR